MSAKDIRNLLDQFNSIEKATLIESTENFIPMSDNTSPPKNVRNIPPSRMGPDADAATNAIIGNNTFMKHTESELKDMLAHNRKLLNHANNDPKEKSKIGHLESVIKEIQAALFLKKKKTTSESTLEEDSDNAIIGNNTYLQHSLKELEAMLERAKADLKRAEESYKSEAFINNLKLKIKEIQAAIFAKVRKPTTDKVMEKWDTKMKTPKNKKGMFDGWTKQELRAELKKLKASGPHKKGSPEFTKQNEVEFALRAKNNWKKVTESDTVFSTLGDIAGFASVAIFGINLLKRMWTYRGPEDLDESDETNISKEQFVGQAIDMLKKHRGYDLHPEDLDKITRMFETIYDEKELGHRDQAAVTAAIRVVMPNASTKEISDAVKTAAADPNKSLMENDGRIRTLWVDKGQEADINYDGNKIGHISKSSNGSTWSAYSNTTKKTQRGFETSHAATNWIKKEYLANARQPGYNGDHEKRIDVSESNTSGNIIDQWINNNTGVDARTLEKLVHDIGYRDLEDFFGDNPDAVAAVMEFVVSAIDQVPEWQSHMRSTVNNMDEPLDEMFNFGKKESNVRFEYERTVSKGGEDAFAVTVRRPGERTSERIGYIGHVTAYHSDPWGGPTDGWIASYSVNTLSSSGSPSGAVRSKIFASLIDAKRWIENRYKKENR